jgi:hypothetical protein
VQDDEKAVQIKDQIQEVADMEKHPVKLECQDANVTVSMDGGEAGALPCLPLEHPRHKTGRVPSSCGYYFTHLRKHDGSCLDRIGHGLLLRMHLRTTLPLSLGGRLSEQC